MVHHYNWVGKPIVDVRDKRLKALQAAEQNAYVGRGAGLHGCWPCRAQRLSCREHPEKRKHRR
jgi:hypothetical protein